MSGQTNPKAAGRRYLLWSINGALYTANAHRPTNHRIFVGWSFFASWITSELAHVHVLWQLAATGYYVRKGALKTRSGQVGLLITLISWIGLLLAILHSSRVKTEVRTALEADGSIDSVPGAHGIRVELGVPVARAGGRMLRTDVYLPDHSPVPGERRPILVQIHGGGWVIGQKRRQGQMVLRRMARRGWVGFNIDYRLSPLATFPDHLVDVKRAIAWIREHADDYNADPDCLVVTGGSAGGHLTALTALTENDPRYQPGFEDADTSVSAAVPFYGVYDFTNRNNTWPVGSLEMFLAPVVMKADLAEAPDLYAQASPLDQVHEDAPPFFVIHGDRDVLASVVDARDFVERLRAVSREPVKYLELAGAQHAFECFPSTRANAVMEGVDHFLGEIYEKHCNEQRERTG